MAKKKLGLEDLGGFVFSTDTDFDENEYLDEDANKKIDPEDQMLEAHFSNKSRGGKTVTIIKAYQGPEEELTKLGKMLKKKCGVGGSVKNGEIIIQGDDREKIIQILKDKNYNVKRVGG